MNSSSMIRTDFHLLPSRSLFNVLLTNNEILEIIKGLNPSKVHEHNVLNNFMEKLCGISIGRLLGLLVISSLRVRITYSCLEKTQRCLRSLKMITSQ